MYVMVASDDSGVCGSVVVVVVIDVSDGGGGGECDVMDIERVHQHLSIQSILIVSI
jgi:hypothetical protein